jgi:hypothetical protein
LFSLTANQKSKKPLSSGGITRKQLRTKMKNFGLLSFIEYFQDSCNDIPHCTPPPEFTHKYFLIGWLRRGSSNPAHGRFVIIYG